MILDVDMPLLPGEWVEDGLCARPEHRSLVDDGGWDSEAPRPRRETHKPSLIEQEGARVCQSCPVRARCLEEGMRPENLNYGTYGGVYPFERLVMAGAVSPSDLRAQRAGATRASVLDLHGQGLDQREIAKQLNLGVRAVATIISSSRGRRTFPGHGMVRGYGGTMHRCHCGLEYGDPETTTHRAASAAHGRHVLELIREREAA